MGDIKRMHKSLRKKGAENKDEAEEMFNFHSAVAAVVETEERVVEEHRAAIQLDRELLDEGARLLGEVDGVDYDVDDYARRLDEILTTKVERLTALKKSVAAFRQMLAMEEQASKK